MMTHISPPGSALGSPRQASPLTFTAFDSMFCAFKKARPTSLTDGMYSNPDGLPGPTDPHQGNPAIPNEAGYINNKKYVLCSSMHTVQWDYLAIKHLLHS